MLEVPERVTWSVLDKVACSVLDKVAAWGSTLKPSTTTQTSSTTAEIAPSAPMLVQGANLQVASKSLPCRSPMVMKAAALKSMKAAAMKAMKNTPASLKAMKAVKASRMYPKKLLDACDKIFCERVAAAGKT